MMTVIRSLIDRELALALPAAEIAPSADLYTLGLTPYGAVCLLLAVEREFHVEIPREMLRRETARSMEAIFEALQAVQPAPASVEWRKAA